MTTLLSGIRNPYGVNLSDPTLVFYAPLWHPGLAMSPFISRDINRRSCTVTGAIWGRQGRTFDGLDDKITGADVIDVSSGFTCLVWFKRLGDSGGGGADDYHYITGQLNGATNEDNVLLVAKNGSSIAAKVTVDASVKTTGAQSITNVSGFNSIGFWWDGTNLKTFVNGVFGTPLAAAGVLASGSNGLLIGQYSSTIYIANGIEGEIQIYNRPLDISRIQHNDRATKWRYVT